MSVNFIKNLGGGNSLNPKIKYLYKDGDECVSLTNGWQGVPVARSLGSMTKNSNSVSMSCTSSTDIAMVTKLPIDLTQYSKLHASSSTVADDVMDISSINGLHYVAIGIAPDSNGYYVFMVSTNGSKPYQSYAKINAYAKVGNSMVVSKVWLEK